MTHAEFEYELVEALNMLLEDERASVEMEVALASGATEYAEREALTSMGLEDIHFCDQLRAEMERAGLPVTPQINGIVFQVIDAERYDDRLRAFARHQRAVAERAGELQESNLDGPLREALEGITATHERHTQWTERHADTFAATRSLEFGATHSATPAADVAPEARSPTAEGAPEAIATEAAPQQAIAEAPYEAPTEALEEVVSEAVSETPAPSAEQPVEAVAAEAVPAKPQPKPRATRAAARAATPTKAAAKTTAKPKAAARSKAAPAASAAPRRTRRAPAETDATEA